MEMNTKNLQYSKEESATKAGRAFVLTLASCGVLELNPAADMDIGS